LIGGKSSISRIEIDGSTPAGSHVSAVYLLADRAGGGMGGVEIGSAITLWRAFSPGVGFGGGGS
jgi:hypothetical protein